MSRIPTKSLSFDSAPKHQGPTSAKRDELLTTLSDTILQLKRDLLHEIVHRKIVEQTLEHKQNEVDFLKNTLWFSNLVVDDN